MADKSLDNLNRICTVDPLLHRRARKIKHNKIHINISLFLPTRLVSYLSNGFMWLLPNYTYRWSIWNKLKIVNFLAGILGKVVFYTLSQIRINPNQFRLDNRTSCVRPLDSFSVINNFHSDLWFVLSYIWFRLINKFSNFIITDQNMNLKKSRPKYLHMTFPTFRFLTSRFQERGFNLPWNLSA